MLLGNTQMKITHETLVHALQEYFARTFAAGKAPKVTGIQQVRNAAYEMVAVFDVTCEQDSIAGLLEVNTVMALIDPAPPLGARDAVKIEHS